jgi:hypothetical protein
MERELWPSLYHAVKEVGKDFRQKYVSYQPWVLVAVLLWAALHERPLAWACQRRHWSTTKLQPARLPSPATLSRRLDSVAVGALLRALEQRLRTLQRVGLLALLDGKPLAVSGVSKDPDATSGCAAGGGWAKGYKLHTLWANRSLPETWELRPLNESEVTIAKQLLAQAPHAGYVLADGNYDGNAVFDAAARSGYQLLTPMPHPQAGCGHRYQSPYRRRCIALVRSAFGRCLLTGRRRIEQLYGNLVSFGGGLNPLPSWVRGLERVRSWVWAKLLINATRILRRQRLTH